MSQKRVTQQTLRRRRLVAMLILLFIIIMGFVLISKSCSSSDKDKKGNTKVKSSTTTAVTATTMPTQQSAVINTTTARPEGTGTEIVTATATGTPDGSTVESITLTFYSANLQIGESKMPIVTMNPATAANKSERWETSNKSIATVDELGNITGVSAGTCYITVYSVSSPEVYAEVKVKVVEGDDVQPQSNASASQPTYVDGILIANKSYSLPEDYNPGLDTTTKLQFDSLSAAAAKEGLNIYLSSGFRSYSDQSAIYNNYVNNYGQATADTFSARPGYSEHQTGLAIDVNTIDDSFAGTPEAVWLENHAHEYGFIIRYPKGKESITGYKYEPWHIRYLGVEKATDVYNSGKTLEEYLNIDSKYSN